MLRYGTDRKEVRQMDDHPKMPSLRFNDEIVAFTVRVIDEEGNQRGIIPTYEALERARIKGLDLVEVAPGANPPVCRWMDYERWRKGRLQEIRAWNDEHQSAQ